MRTVASVAAAALLASTIASAVPPERIFGPTGWIYLVHQRPVRSGDHVQIEQPVGTELMGAAGAALVSGSVLSVHEGSYPLLKGSSGGQWKCGRGFLGVKYPIKADAEWAVSGHINIDGQEKWLVKESSYKGKDFFFIVNPTDGVLEQRGSEFPSDARYVSTTLGKCVPTPANLRLEPQSAKEISASNVRSESLVLQSVESNGVTLEQRTQSGSGSLSHGLTRLSFGESVEWHDVRVTVLGAGTQGVRYRIDLSQQGG